MKLDLAIIGQGAVTAAGAGADAWLKKTPVPEQVAMLAPGGPAWPVLRIDMKQPAMARWQREPRLRRASPLTFFLTEAADQAARHLDPAARARTGLIVAFSAGCTIYSRRFFQEILTGGQRTASPALFPETVFNSPVSHVAAALRLEGAAYSLVGDETAWIAALETASLWIKRGKVDQAIVLGAEEFDPLVLDAYASARWLRRKAGTGFLVSEGAGGVLVRSARPDDPLVLTRSHTGLIYRSTNDARKAAAALLEGIDPARPIYRTAHHNWFGALEISATAGHPLLPSETYLGEAFTASAAWNTLAAARAVATGAVAQPVWGLNHQVGLLELLRRP